MKKISKGFTLIEVLLVVGIISLATMKIFEYQNSRIVTAAVDRQARNLSLIVQNVTSIAVDITTTNTNLAANVATITTNTNVASLTASGAIPSEMVNGGAIQNIWGGPVLISGVAVGGTPGFQLTFGGVPPEACIKFVTHKTTLDHVQNITINGTIVKNVATVVPNVAQVVTACQNVVNTIIFAADLIHPIKLDPAVNTGLSPRYLRPRETKYNLTPVGQSITTSPLPTPVCNGGSIWNAVISACTCPGATQWTGSRCGTENSNTAGNAGLCPIGQAWNQATNTCNVLPGRAAKTIVNPWVGSQFSPSVTVTVARYGNRMIPSNVATTAQQTLATPTNITAAQCATIPNGRWDGKICQVCLVRQDPNTGAALPGSGTAGMGAWSVDRCTTN